MSKPTEVKIYFCESIVAWSIQVPSSTEQGKFYTVRWERLTPSEMDRAQSVNEFGFTCTCTGFAHRGQCRHTAQARTDFCGWNSLIYGQNPITDGVTGEFKCPQCGKKVGVAIAPKGDV